MEALLVFTVGLVVAIQGVLWVLSDPGGHRDRARRVGRVLHLVEPPPASPCGPPIERVAADARRIRAEIMQAPPGLPVARRRGWVQAYDDVLATACRELGLEERLGDLPEGAKRDLERERVERMLTRAGLQLRSSA